MCLFIYNLSVLGSGGVITMDDDTIGRLRMAVVDEKSDDERWGSFASTPIQLPSDERVARHLHWRRHRCRVALLGNYINASRCRVVKGLLTMSTLTQLSSNERATWHLHRCWYKCKAALSLLGNCVDTNVVRGPFVVRQLYWCWRSE